MGAAGSMLPTRYGCVNQRKIDDGDTVHHRVVPV
jgi:hypothetical protein